MTAPDFGAAKVASACRNVPIHSFHTLSSEQGSEGDVCLFRVESAGTDHPYLEHPCGRYQRLFADDLVVATLGTRHSTKWLSGTLPADGSVRKGTILTQLSNSGVFGELLGASSEFDIAPVRAEFLGVISAKGGRSIRLRNFAPALEASSIPDEVTLMMVMGTSAEAGKSTAVAAVCQVAKRSRLSCGVAKMCGTSSVAELQSYLDAGADFAVDCVDIGLPTTYSMSKPAARDAALLLPSYLTRRGAKLIVCEFGGDILGGGAAEMINALRASRIPATVILAANDPFAAAYATKALQDIDLCVTLICGRCSDSEPSRRRTQDLTGVPAMSFLHLDSTQLHNALVGSFEGR